MPQKNQMTETEKAENLHNTPYSGWSQRTYPVSWGYCQSQVKNISAERHTFAWLDIHKQLKVIDTGQRAQHKIMLSENSGCNGIRWDSRCHKKSILNAMGMFWKLWNQTMWWPDICFEPLSLLPWMNAQQRRLRSTGGDQLEKLGKMATSLATVRVAGNKVISDPSHWGWGWWVAFSFSVRQIRHGCSFLTKCICSQKSGEKCIFNVFLSFWETDWDSVCESSLLQSSESQMRVDLLIILLGDCIMQFFEMEFEKWQWEFCSLN